MVVGVEKMYRNLKKIWLRFDTFKNKMSLAQNKSGKNIERWGRAC